MMSGDSPPDDDGDDGVGYRKPPKATRFTEGQSGNPGGRPRGRWREAPYETVLGQMVTIREDGVERRVTADEAFLLQHTKSGHECDGAAAHATMTVIEEVTERSSTRRMALHQPHRPHRRSTRECHICARAIADGQET